MLTDITYPAGSIGNVHYAYDAYGRRASMTDGTGGQTYAYDDDNDLTTKNVAWNGFPAKTLAYGFYPDGSRSSMNADGRAFSYGYDGVGRMNRLTNDNSETTRYAYQDNGWLQTKTLANGVATTFTRDTQGRLRDLANKTSAGAVLSDFSVPATGGYDGVSNRLSVTASLPGAPASYSGTTHYAYDYGQSANPQLNRSQLTQETSARASGTFSYGYDGGTSGGPGNPTSFKATTSAFNSDNQATSAVIRGRSLPYVYDGNGNPTTYQGSAVTFDPENRLISAGSNQTGTYDGDGLRTCKQSGNNTGRLVRTYFLYDGDLLVSQYLSINSGTSSLSTSTYGADGLVSVCSTSTSASTFYTFDERGNVAQRLDKNAAVLSSDMYDAYGGQTTTGSGNTYGFGGQAGYYTDGTLGLILCTHRYYDPQTGRWLTRDPMGYDGGINLYGYCGNDPGNRWDPLGFSTITIGISGGIEAIPIIGPITAGAGFSGGISFDSNGTIAISGSRQGQVGVGINAQSGVSGGYSTGNLNPPGNGGINVSGNIYGGVGGGVGPVSGSVTAPIYSLPGGFGGSPPTYSVSVGPGAGASAYGIIGGEGEVEINIPGLVQGIRNFFNFPPIPGTSPNNSCPPSNGPGGDPTLTPIPQ